MSNKLIDIIIPAYKSHLTIGKTLASIAMQSIIDVIKVTIVNDADGMGYKDLVDVYSNFFDIEEITLKNNSGPGVARQYAIDTTSCPYIVFVDSDDTFFNSFALEMMLNSIETSNTCSMVMAKHYLAARVPNLKFIPHAWNYVWVFAKIYRRSFLNKYNIRFPNSRSNEDVGFNQSIHLIAVSEEEKPLKLDEIVYCWHENPNSITRSNEDFCFNENILGYIDNMIYGIKKGRNTKVKNTHQVLNLTISTMADLYVFYEEAHANKPEYDESNFKGCVKFYNEIFKIIEMTQDSSLINQLVLKELKRKTHQTQEFFPDMTFHQFMIKIREEKYETD